VPPPVTGTITVGGSPVIVTTTAPGQYGIFTFSGSVGQQVTTTVSSVTNPLASVFLIDPSFNYVDGVPITSMSGYGPTFTMGPDTLPSTGTYYLWIFSFGSSFGSETLQLN
jgi:hypothetical protein